MVDIATFPRPPRLDDRPVRHRMGLVARATDHTSEVDYARILCPRGVGVYVSRIPYANPVTPGTLAAMAPDLAGGAALILPGEPLDALVFGCTSASAVIGDAAVTAAIHRGKPGVRVVTPVSAVLAGLRAVGARRISVLTPYTAATSAPMARLLETEGFTLDRFTCLGMDDDRDMARIAPDDIVDLARAALAPGSDAVFVSCTAVRAAQVIDRIEDATGVPAVSSNHAVAWNVLRILGDEGAGAPGRLMRLPMTS